MASSLQSVESINEELLTCPICNEIYDEDVYTPRNLPCGHTICSLCVEKLIQSLYKHCPECRKILTVSTSTDLPICYIATRIVRDINKQKLEQKANPPPSLEDKSECTASISESNATKQSTKTEPKLVSEQSERPLKNISLSLESLFGSGNYLKRLQERTTHEIACNEDCINKLKEELSKNETDMKNIRNHMKHEEMRVHKMNELDSLFHDLELKMGMAETITDLDEIIEEILETKETAEAVLKDEEHLCSLEEFIGNKVIKDQFERCRKLYAEQTVNGIKKYAKMSQSGYIVLLHILRALPQPNADSEIVQYGQIRARVPRLCSAFMYLYWDGSMQGMVEFSLNNCRHGHHFVAMILGDKGRSFLNSILFGSVDDGVLSSHKSLSGPSLVIDATPFPDCIRATTANNEGLLAAQVLEPTNELFGAFRIDTQRKGDRNTPHHIFGKCVAGLNVLRAVAARKKVDDVVVKDCAVNVASF